MIAGGLAAEIQRDFFRLPTAPARSAADLGRSGERDLSHRDARPMRSSGLEETGQNVDYAGAGNLLRDSGLPRRQRRHRRFARPLSTTAQSAASAGSIFHAAIRSGIPGMIWPTTPTGSFTV